MNKNFFNRSIIRKFFSNSVIDSSKLKIQVIDSEKRPKIDLTKNLGFGEEFSPHMLTIDHSDISGWESPMIKPLECFSVHPANSTLHYAITCYEGSLFKRLF